MMRYVKRRPSKVLLHANVHYHPCFTEDASGSLNWKLPLNIIRLHLRTISWSPHPKEYNLFG